MLENKVEKYLIKRVREAGGRTRKLRYIGRRGCPDRLILLPGLFALAECKRPGKGLRLGQEKEARILKASGIYVYVLDSIYEVDYFMSIYA